MKGEIVRLVRGRGFGFIRDESGHEVFFHATGVTGSSFDNLSEGEHVDYEVERDPRSGKDRAVNVKREGDSASM